jgi:GNAT superfamily N-acetyltransferase
MSLRFEQVTDAEGARRWQALEARAVPLDHPGLVAEPLAEIESMVTGESRAERPVLFVASDGGGDVANAVVWLPLLDNLENASVFFSVDPEHRGRGVGAAFADALIEFARAEGRGNVIFFTVAPLDGRDAPGDLLARKLGAELAFVGLRRQLDVAGVDDAELEALLREHVGSHADGYELVTWIDRLPDRLVDDGARLMGRMVTDAPMGDLDWEPEVWDAKRYRDKEDEAIARHRRRVAAGAVERATGRLVAYTDIGVSTIDPTVAYQWDTIVDPEHRGHRLGLLVKVANLRQLRQDSPATLTMQTWNAESNAHMVAINDLLGFRPMEFSRQYQLGV